MTSPAHSLSDLQKWIEPLERGFHVFPLIRHRKEAAVKWGPWASRTPTDADLRSWQGADYNVGIITGANSGIVVLDLDSEEALLFAFERGLPRTLTVRTPRGMHLYFKHPGGKFSNKVGLFPGADLRGDGGYVVGPGSMFEPDQKEQSAGKKPGMYEISEDAEPAQLPNWLLDIAQQKAAVSSPRPYTEQADRDAFSDRAALQLERLRTAEVGTRNDALNKAAFY